MPKLQSIDIYMINYDRLPGQLVSLGLRVISKTEGLRVGSYYFFFFQGPEGVGVI